MHIISLSSAVLSNIDAIRCLVAEYASRPTAVCCFLPSKQEEWDVFAFQLRQLLSIVMPVSKAMRCLDTPSCNPADVYKFWLAVMAAVRVAFADTVLSLPPRTKREIAGIFEFRYGQMTSPPSNTVLQAALFLDPGELRIGYYCEVAAEARDRMGRVVGMALSDCARRPRRRRRDA